MPATLLNPDPRISSGLRKWLQDHFKPSEEARLFLIKDLGELGEELPNIKIESDFELVGLRRSVYCPVEHELHLSWHVDDISMSYANGFCAHEFDNSIRNAITAGLLPKDGCFTPPIRTVLIKNFDRDEPLLCLPEEIHGLRQAAHQKINACFNATINFSP